MSNASEFESKLRAIREDKSVSSKREFIFDMGTVTSDCCITLEDGKSIIKALPFLDKSRLHLGNCWRSSFPSDFDVVSEFIVTNIIENCERAFRDYDVIKLISPVLICNEEPRRKIYIVTLDHKHTKFLELNEFSTGKIVHTSSTFCAVRWFRHDFWAPYINPDDAEKYGSYEGVAFMCPCEFVVFKADGNPYDGMNELPTTATILSGMVLRDCKVHTSFLASEENDYTLNIAGNVVIESDVPIVTESRVIIKGERGSKLTLRSTEDKQPCIGARTRTGMSYGRWCPEGKCPKEITVDGVEVVCESLVENFSIGQYGSEEIPNITLLNGGRLDCPETEGTRVVLHMAVAPEGSTKIADKMRYGLRVVGQTAWDLFSNEKKRLYEELKNVNPTMCEYISVSTSEATLSKVIALSKMKSGINCKRFIEMSERGRGYIGRCADILCMPDKLVTSDAEMPEFIFETVKAEYIEKEFYGTFAEPVLSVKTLIKFFLDRVTNMSDYTAEVLYEAIPSYFYNYPESMSHRDMLLDFIAKADCDIDMKMYTELCAHKDEILSKWS